MSQVELRGARQTALCGYWKISAASGACDLGSSRGSEEFYRLNRVAQFLGLAGVVGGDAEQNYIARHSGREAQATELAGKSLLLKLAFPEQATPDADGLGPSLTLHTREKDGLLRFVFGRAEDLNGGGDEQGESFTLGLVGK